MAPGCGKRRTRVATFDWESEVCRWCQARSGIWPALADSIVSFFRLSFQNLQCPDRAWFGCHPSVASVVVGGVWLAAINRTGTDRGVWLVVDQDSPQLTGLDYRPVKSTQASEHPLVWAHTDSLEAIPHIVACRPLWGSFHSATVRILTSSRSAGDRDDVQVRRNKRPVSEFWPGPKVCTQPGAAP
jgi:hypothetical protein